jgi:hypothetical protein
MPIPTEVVDLLICCAGVDPEKGPKLEALISKGVDWIWSSNRDVVTGFSPSSTGPSRPIAHIKSLIRS